MAIEINPNDGLYERILRLCGGNEQLAKQWWDSPNPAFNLQTPRDLMNADRWEEIREYIMGKADYVGAKLDFGPREQFYNDAKLDSVNYYHDEDLKVQKYMESLRTSIGPWKRKKKDDVIL